MKKLILLALVLFSAATMLAQTNRMSYQAVVRNAANELVAEENLTVAIRISDANSTSAFSETHSVTSNRNGVISLMIGEGSGQSGNMTSVDWRTAQIHTVVTLSDGATLTNTTPVNAVPYAFYADSVDIHWVNDAVDDYLEHHSIGSIVETDPTVPAWAKEATKPVYDYSEIENTPTIPTNVGELTNDANYITLEQVPAQVNADWNATEGAAQILNKPELFSGDYNDLTNKPTIPTVPTNVGAFTNDAGYITAAEVPAVSVPTNVSAFDNDAEYVTTNQLNAANYITAADVPAQVNADWNATTGAAQILNKPELFSGDYNDLTNKPTIPTVPTNVGAFTNDAGYITAEEVPAVSVPTNVSAFTNDAEYVTTNQLNAANYITAADVPAQVNADWNATTGAAQILNKPELFSGDYNDLTNKPAIPTVPTNVGEFNNDAGYITAADIAGLLNTVNELNRKVDSLEDVVSNMSEPPVLETVGVSDVGIIKATFHGNITSEGYYSVIARGFCYGTSEDPTIGGNFTSDGTGDGAFSHTVTALQANTTYYVRAYATTPVGTTYGNQLSFTTKNYIGQPCPSTPTVTDHEGNVYNTVQIGTQCWTKENLRTTTSPSTGTYLIPAAGTDYTYTGKQARWYNNDSATYAPMNYGLLYNWNAAVDTFNTAYGETSVNTDDNNAKSVTFNGYRRGICPAGWHLPSDAEWMTLTYYVGGVSEYQCGGSSSNIAKALASETGWNSNSYYSGECYPCDQSVTENNATGFSAVPACNNYGSTIGYCAGDLTFFWSATQNANYPKHAFIRYLSYVRTGVYRTYDEKSYGFSVRCVKD